MRCANAACPAAGELALQPAGSAAPAALDAVRPGLAMARRLGFERPLRLDGGLLPGDYAWRNWDALQASVAASDPVGSRHQLRQPQIGLRMQITPMHLAPPARAARLRRAFYWSSTACALVV